MRGEQGSWRARNQARTSGPDAESDGGIPLRSEMLAGLVQHRTQRDWPVTGEVGTAVKSRVVMLLAGRRPRSLPELDGVAPERSVERAITARVTKLPPRTTQGEEPSAWETGSLVG